MDRYRELGWEYQEVTLRQAIRINMINVNKEADFLQRLRSIGIRLAKVAFLDNGYWVSRSKFSAGSTSEYLLGLYSIQEAAAQIPVTVFTETKGQIVLDACAAPGGKTVQLADSMRNTGAIVALDVKKERLMALANQLERCHVRNTAVYFCDAREVSRFKIGFDRILLDMPCSGNFATDRKWFSRRTIKDVKRNAVLQRQILTEAFKVLNDDGEIVYSTCSLEPEEDEENINWAIRTLDLELENIECYGQKGLTNVFGKRLDASLEKCKRIWPGQTQGFFLCKMRKRKTA